MKTRHIISLLLIILFSLSACREINVTTKVHKDGSFTRIITITGDSSSVFEPGLPYPIDATWEKKVAREDSTDASDYILTYTKTFKKSKELNAELKSDTGWRNQLDREIKIRNRFGFFYSYPVYREVCKASNPFTSLNYAEYLSAEDIQWLSGYKLAANSIDSAALEEAGDRADLFLEKAVAQEVMQVLKIGLMQLNDPGLDPADVIQYKDSIESKINEWSFDSLGTFIDYYREWTNQPEVLKLHDLDPPLFNALDKKAELLVNIIGMDFYVQTVEMPGLIIETNAPSISGNTVNWNVDVMSFLFQDFEMLVESRVVNTWAFIVAGIMLLTLIVVLIWRVKK